MKIDDIQPHFPTDTITLSEDPDRINQLRGASLATKKVDLVENFDYQFVSVVPMMGPSTYQCVFRPKKGGADFISDPSLWAAGIPFYTICNELAARS